MNTDFILRLHDYEMVYAIEKLAETAINPFYFSNQKHGLAACNVLSSRVSDLVEAVDCKKYAGVRKAICNLVIETLKIAYRIDMNFKEKDVKSIYFDKFLFPREDYICYCNDLYDTTQLLQNAIYSQNVESIKEEVLHLLSRAYFALPEFSRFSIRDDLVAVVQAYLSKSEKVFLDQIAEESVWSCYKNIELKGLTYREVKIA